MRKSPLPKHFTFDGTQAADLLAQLYFGMAIRLHHRLSQVTQKVVDAVAMWSVGEHARYALDESVPHIQ